MLSMVLSSMCLFKYIVIMMSINVNNFCLLQTLSLYSVLLKILLVVLFTVYCAFLLILVTGKFIVKLYCLSCYKYCCS